MTEREQMQVRLKNIEHAARHMYQVLDTVELDYKTLTQAFDAFAALGRALQGNDKPGLQAQDAAMVAELRRVLSEAARNPTVDAADAAANACRRAMPRVLDLLDSALRPYGCEPITQCPECGASAEIMHELGCGRLDVEGTLRAWGYDPAEVDSDGRAFVQRLLDDRREQRAKGLTPMEECPQCHMQGQHKMDCTYR